MSDSSKLLIVHRKSSADAVLDVRDDTDGSSCDKGQRPVCIASRKTVFAALGFVMLLIIIGANLSRIQSGYKKPPKKASYGSPPAIEESILIRSRLEAQNLQARVDTLRAELHNANGGEISREKNHISAGQKLELRVSTPALQQQPVQALSSISMLSQSSEQQPSANVHAHLLAFIKTLNSAGRSMRSDCDDPDFKDADLVNVFLSKKVDICSSTLAVQPNGGSKITSSHIVCYQHQQTRHTATDSICEGHNVALHLPSFEGSGMSAFVEATWMSMKQGALLAACTPTGPFTKDKFPLCLGDWFVSGFRQVTVRSLYTPLFTL
jgi:hypothetical protein